MPEIKYEVVEKIGIVSEGNNGWNIIEHPVTRNFGGFVF